ncbi:DUF3050 domain-containing protein [Terriglobus aquaticus]|uniref:DUF3050 domain-containing protein n=1 Tax=Terriglobus aquaticus TaxID=940139 RepID=A0ABW9KNH7_9BACT|nr:DUF3050 domain-containing protein [Terriglobus aquaticus]
MNVNPRISALTTRLQPLYTRLSQHPLYASLETLKDLHLFMEAHVFAVWDFMSLLKALQRGLTSVEVPWTPSPLPESRRLINEIVLGEESDVYQGEPLSHFELYRLAMQQCGASTAAIDALLQSLRNGDLLGPALAASGAPQEAQSFVGDTFALLAQDKLHVTAAAFTFGREDLIPDMFQGFVRDLNRELAGRLETFVWYLQRHIEVDGEEHGPMALRMISELCGDDETKWQEAETAAVHALESRLRLWDGIHAKVRARRSVPALA